MVVLSLQSYPQWVLKSLDEFKRLTARAGTGSRTVARGLGVHLSNHIGELESNQYL